MDFNTAWVKAHKKPWLDHIKSIRKVESAYLDPAQLAARIGTPYNIWLGGPSKRSNLRGLRELARYCLEMDGFKVYYSENSPRKKRIRSMEVGHIGSFDLAILPLLTPGTVAEAFDFMKERSICSKVMVFIPKEYKGGFACRACEELCYVSSDRLFSLSDAHSGSPEFIEQVWRISDDNRSIKYVTP